MVIINYIFFFLRQKKGRKSFKSAQMLTKQCLKKLRAQKARSFLLQLHYIIILRLYKWTYVSPYRVIFSE